MPTAARAGGTAERKLRTALLPLLVALSAVTAATTAGAQNDTIARTTASGSVFSPDGDGDRDTVTFSVSLRRRARMTVTVRDAAGATVRTLVTNTWREGGTHSWTWDGRDIEGRIVRDGYYSFRVVAANSLGTAAAGRRISKVSSAIYTANPAAIQVVLSAGHGGRDPGAYYGGLREADLNLDIALRLQRMLEDAGVTVVMTRTTNTPLNDPPEDVNGDGSIDYSDEMMARNDLANEARADVFINLMNNAYACHCVRGTETFTSNERSWTPEGIALARLVQHEHIRLLQGYSGAAWHPIDRGVRFHDFYSMRPYDPKRVPRPMLMPSILTESLFMDHPEELAVLARADARESLALAYYNGIRRYLNTRRYGVRYEVVDVPTSARKGERPRYAVAITNRGNARSAGWVLELRYVRAVPRYDGSGQLGKLLASRRVPDGLDPGESTRMAFEEAPMPPEGGDWLLKADVRLPDGSYLSDHGVVALQTPLTVSPIPFLELPSLAPSPIPPVDPSPIPSVLPSAGVAPEHDGIEHHGSHAGEPDATGPTPPTTLGWLSYEALDPSAQRRWRSGELAVPVDRSWYRIPSVTRRGGRPGEDHSGHDH